MRGKRAAALAFFASAAIFMGGCSFSGLMEKAVDLITDTATADTSSQPAKHAVEAREVDKNLALPVFNENIAGASIGQAGLAVTLDGTATVSDGGLLTYQWYKNTVDSNGGGTAIEGATEAVYVPDTTEVGSTFYYVVVANNQGDKINMLAGPTHEVEIWGEGRWQQNPELGAYQYVILADERYPSSLSMEINGTLYIFDEDGYVIDADGHYIDVQTGEPILEEEPVEPEPTPTPEPQENGEGGDGEAGQAEGGENAGDGTGEDASGEGASGEDAGSGEGTGDGAEASQETGGEGAAEGTTEDYTDNTYSDEYADDGGYYE